MAEPVNVLHVGLELEGISALRVGRHGGWRMGMCGRHGGLLRMRRVGGADGGGELSV